MKKIIFILFAVAIASVNSMAQEPGRAQGKTPEERAENITKRLTKELDLSPEQQAKTKALILKQEQDRVKLQEQLKADREKMQAQMKQDHEQMKAQFQTLLSSDQFKKFEAKEKEMKEKQEARKDDRMKKTGAPKPEEK
ncbi:MAG: hypothetical protein ACJ77K_15720 [Bacteroidia bacterium]